MEMKKLVRSALICVSAVLLFALVKLLYPSQDYTAWEGALITAVSAWIVNTVKEYLKSQA